MIEVQHKGERKQFAPEEVSAMVLTKMKEAAEKFLRKKVKDTVVSVPASFNDLQRQATKNAGAVAGLNILSVINEPTAAAIAYGVDEKAGSPSAITAGTKEGVIKVEATAGDTHLGGEDFTDRLVNHFVQVSQPVLEFERKHKKEMSSNPTAMHRLRMSCERAKCALSSAPQATVGICSLHRTIEAVEKCPYARLIEAHIVLVGGSHTYPQLHQLLQDLFPGNTFYCWRSASQAPRSRSMISCSSAPPHAAMLTGQGRDTARMGVHPLSPFFLHHATSRKPPCACIVSSTC
ncbi:unnamed protein product [Closterium sp. NIES-64]|nr:unnamed protein product [Closterium sp. NIES-64]